MAATTAVRERPILMSGPMVRAVLSGAKSQTRRVIKSPEKYQHIRDCAFCCPLGQPGDALWVRETWRWYGRYRNDRPEGGLEYRADLKSRMFDDFLNPLEVYQAFDLASITGQTNKWRPSIHMPRWASRLTLEITDVRVERLGEISATDVRAEGVACPEHDFPSGFCTSHCPDLIGVFRELWDSLYGRKPGCDWAANPWCWTITFNRIDT